MFYFCVNIQKRCSEQLAGVHCQLAAHGTSLVRIVSGSSRCSWSRVLSVDELVMTRCMSAEETLEWSIVPAEAFCAGLGERCSLADSVKAGVGSPGGQFGGLSSREEKKYAMWRRRYRSCFPC